jgi:opacity protein-like surface antigen
MKLLRLRRLLAVAALALAVPAVAQANAVTQWNKTAVDTLVAFPGPAGSAAQALQIDMAMTQGAVYDAVNAIEPRHRPYLLGTPFVPTASKDAAAATAAYRVLSNIVSTVPASIAFPNRAALLMSLASAYTASLATIPDGASKDAGIAAGTAASDAMLAARANDGRFGPSPWVSNTSPGHWQPLLNPDGSPQLDPAAWVANVKPFLLHSPSQFRTDGPNALDSTAYAADVNETEALGSATSSVRTAEQTHNAIFWQTAGGPAWLWNGAARGLVDSRGLDLGDSALLFAMLNLASADASINVWNDKYHYDFWRPWQAIRGADLDGNPATAADPTWTALITAPYPEHPSGHIGLDSAALEALRTFFGTNKLTLEVTSSRFPGETRTFTKVQQPLKELVEARIWAGLHFRTADVQARHLGRQVARYMAKHYFQPLR